MSIPPVVSQAWLAEHPEGEPRRRENVRRLLTVPFAAVRTVGSGR